MIDLLMLGSVALAFLIAFGYVGACIGFVDRGGPPG